MPLTGPQLNTLREHVRNTPAMAAALAAGTFTPIQEFYNGLASPTFFVWNRAVLVEDVEDEIDFKNLTPVYVPAADITAAFTNRALVCQGKQFNLQLIFKNKTLIDATRARTRADLQDALTNVPAGNSGNLLDAGWPRVQGVLARAARRGEALFANTGGQNGNGSTAVLAAMARVEGEISLEDFIKLRDLP